MMTAEQLTLIAAIVSGTLALCAAILSLATTLCGVIHQNRVNRKIRRIYPFISYMIVSGSKFESIKGNDSSRSYTFYKGTETQNDIKLFLVKFRNLDNYKIIDLQVRFSFEEDGNYHGIGTLYEGKDIYVVFAYSDVLKACASNNSIYCEILYYTETYERIKFESHILIDDQNRMTNGRKDTMFWGKSFQNSKVVLDGLEISRV